MNVAYNRPQNNHLNIERHHTFYTVLISHTYFISDKELFFPGEKST